MGKTIKELRAAVRSAREKVDSLNGVEGKEQEFAAAERSYKMALADYQEATVEELERKAETKPDSAVLRNEAMHKTIRSAMNGGVKEFKVERAAAAGVITSETDMTAAGLPVSTEELLGVLEMPTVYDKVGIKIQTGVRGQIVWPVVNTIGAVQVAGENVKVNSAAIDFGKVTAAQKRLSISFNASNESINDASFDLYSFIIEQTHARLAAALNTAVLSTTGLGALTGPFAGTQSKRGSVDFAADLPTYKELLKMKGTVAGKGVDMKGFAYAVSPSTYAALEATPITEGDSRMILADGKIAGYPVFETNDVADNTVVAGCFAYAALNQHGDVSLIVDPYTEAQSGVTRFILNADWSLTTLRPEAFCIGKKA